MLSVAGEYLASHNDRAALEILGQQNGYIKSFSGSLRVECLNEDIFDSFADARRTLAL